MGTKKIGIAGCGTIGQKVATELDRGSIPGVNVEALTSRNLEPAARFAD